jgi:hypothetical protein
LIGTYSATNPQERGIIQGLWAQFGHNEGRTKEK